MLDVAIADGCVDEVAEATNIIARMQWAEAQVRTGIEVASDTFLRTLHARLFGQVWAGAGK